MAQVMVNFRMDEEVKKRMEQASKEMGMSMTTAFTIFATKVGREKRIPFEITAAPAGPAPLRPERAGKGFTRRKERLERLCGEIRRSLTAIHTAIPSAVTGLTMERIRLLCGDELKDKNAAAARACESLFSPRNAETLEEKDIRLLDEYEEGLAAAAEEVRLVEDSLVPALRAWNGGDTQRFARHEERLTSLSRQFDQLSGTMQRFLGSVARRPGGGRSVQARLRQAAETVETPYVLTALEALEAQILRDYDLLDRPAKVRLEAEYLQTLELTLRELAAAEKSGEDPVGKAALCLRTVNVLSQVLTDSRQARQELNSRSLEAEVSALERLAAMRGDIAGDL